MISAIAHPSDSATQAAQPQSTAPPQPELKFHPALTPDQTAKLDEALTRLASQLAQMRKRTLPYSAEPAFVFRAEAPRRPAPAAPKA
jgi:hypothetical protein